MGSRFVSRWKRDERAFVALEDKVRELTASVDYWGRQASHWQQRYVALREAYGEDT